MCQRDDSAVTIRKQSEAEWKREGPKTGGAEGIRTPDPHNAIVVLYQLSYDPNRGAKLRVTHFFVKKFPRRESERPART